jgi:hypothetical protein
MVTLMYKAYSVSCNLNGSRGIMSFIGALITVEALTLIIFFAINSYTPSLSDERQDNNTETVIPMGQTIHQTAGIVVEALNKSEMKTVRAYFDNTMKKRLSEQMLKKVWDSKTYKLGELISADTDVAPGQIGQYHILLIPCTFQKGNFKLQLTFNSEGKIAGIFFRPAGFAIR